MDRYYAELALAIGLDLAQRATGCAHVDLALPGASERRARLAADPLEEEEVREAAREARRASE